MILDYSKAKKQGERAYRRAVVKGQYPYLPSLEEMVSEVDRYPEIPLGHAEIPIDMIVGTRTSGRQNAFAWNFMPLMAENTEFAMKWSHLYDAQVEEGIRDPVKVYEFMNRFYVEEGNKRVSVMRYVGAVSIPANVIRIRPPKTDSEQSRIYYEFLDFYKVTKLFEITFSAPGRYAQLARILEQNLHDPWPEDLLEKLHAGFIAFREAYQARGGLKMGLTVGDAFLIYLGIYSLDSLLREGKDEIGRRLLRLWREFTTAAHPDGIALIEKREDVEQSEGRGTPLSRAAKIVEKTVERTGAVSVAGAAELAGAFAGITAGAGAAEVTKNVVRSGLEAVIPAAAAASRPGFSPDSPLRIAFIHEKDAEHSGWVYGHELGRLHLQETFGNLVETMHFNNCRTEEEIEEAFSTILAEDCRLVFTTSVSLTQHALRFALDHPSVKVLNCSFNQAQHAVRFYYGKMYEAKYIIGALAASLTDDHTIGYIAGKKDLAAISNINAFALGAQLIDPYCRIKVQWIGEDMRIDGSCWTEEKDSPETASQAQNGSGPETASGTETVPGPETASGTETAPGPETASGTETVPGPETASGTETASETETASGLEKASGVETGLQGADELEHFLHPRTDGKSEVIHVFSDIDMIRPGEKERRYGLYYRDEKGEFRRLAAPIWNWGMFYEIVVRRVLENTYDNMPAQQKERALNYWLGISSGIIDVILSDSLPRPSRRLVDLLRKGIADERLGPFEGVLYDREGHTHGTEGGFLTRQEIMAMDWFVENVD